MDKQIKTAKTYLDKYRSSTNEKSNDDKLDATKIVDINNLDVPMDNIFVEYLNFFIDFFYASGYFHLFFVGVTALLGILVVNNFYTKKRKV